MSHRLLPIRKEGDETVVTIEIRGWYDSYRFAHMMTNGQVEFAQTGYKIIQKCHDDIGDRSFWKFMQHLWGKGDMSHPTKEEIEELKSRARYYPVVATSDI